MSVCKICHQFSQKYPLKSFFRFPKNRVRCEEWARICNIETRFKSLGSSECYRKFRICSDHFDPNFMRFDGKKRQLLPNAVPTMYSPIYESTGSTGRTKLDIDIDVNETAREFDEMLSYNHPEFSVQNVNQLCRLCAKDNEKLTPIFSEEGKIANRVLMLEFIPITVAENDYLPTGVCENCINKVEEINIFINDCVNAEVKLRALLEFDGVASTINADDQCVNLSSEKSVVETNYQENCDRYPADYRYIDLTGSYSLQHDYSQMWMGNVSNRNRYWKQWKTYSCELCKKSFETLDILKAHKKAYDLYPNAEGDFLCETCKTTFKSRYLLCAHVRVHTGEKPYKCQICNKKFRRDALLKQHRFKHTPKSFQCNQCKKAFSRKNQLTRHLQTVCLKSEHEIGTLPTHLLVVRNPDNSRKTVQDMQGDNVEVNSFETSNIQTIHVDILVSNTGLSTENMGVAVLKHSETSRASEVKEGNETRSAVRLKKQHLKCEVCHRQFNTLGGLGRHRTSHWSKKRFPCVTCGHVFGRMDTLKRHIRIHTGERPFVCRICGFAFKQKGDCNKHESNHH